MVSREFNPRIKGLPPLRNFFKVSNEDFSYLRQFGGLGVIAQGRKSYIGLMSTEDINV